ncbi:HAD family hydrolase [Suicoccus acidiformans]|uniref:HAD family hydrolase n=1 Tax=Suicoccus acidiformans TaxID=2036206 RepID=A0A347WI11_9LACT|nr:Cof-type HAD-IIB family hydrolase [Suicoccus acidiformans]AXY24718.1 HAD family hydrolase [Suicoccus acidiformans]
MAKTIFLDVDGTLVDYHNRVPESAIEAITQARANGHRIFLVTGRSKSESYDELMTIGFDGYIGGNGSYVEADGEELFHQTLSLEEATSIIDWLKNRGLEYYVEANTGLFASENFAERGKPVMMEYIGRKGQEIPAHFEVTDAMPDLLLDRADEGYRDDVNKISFILDSYADFEAAREHFSAYKVGTWGGHGETALFGDMALPNIDKAVAIDKLINLLGIAQADTMAFGDAKVDIPMLEYSAVGIAMGNGGPEIKAMADYITSPVDEDGLYQAFQHFGLLD